jgi:predicted ABC-type ATPase
MPSGEVESGRARIFVLAGTNGAGKSSVGGAALRQRGGRYFNPDEAAGSIREQQPHLSLEQANSAAWHQGRRLLETAIAHRLPFNFETTLGGDTIPALLEAAAIDGADVRIWYVALASPGLHVARVRARVARGGHDIPEEKIRERYDRSREHLIGLLPHLTELRVFDNSAEADPVGGADTPPLLVLHLENGAIRAMCPLADVPEWAKPIVAAALRLAR